MAANSNGNAGQGAAAPGQMPGLNSSQKQAVAQVAAQDAQRGATVHVSAGCAFAAASSGWMLVSAARCEPAADVPP